MPLVVGERLANGSMKVPYVFNYFSWCHLVLQYFDWLLFRPTFSHVLEQKVRAISTHPLVQISFGTSVQSR